LAVGAALVIPLSFFLLLAGFAVFAVLDIDERLK